MTGDSADPPATASRRPSPCEKRAMTESGTGKRRRGAVALSELVGRVLEPVTREARLRHRRADRRLARRSSARPTRTARQPEKIVWPRETGEERRRPACSISASTARAPSSFSTSSARSSSGSTRSSAMARSRQVADRAGAGAERSAQAGEQPGSARPGERGALVSALADVGDGAPQGGARPARPRRARRARARSRSLRTRRRNATIDLSCPRRFRHNRA